MELMWDPHYSGNRCPKRELFFRSDCRFCSYSVSYHRSATLGDGFLSLPIVELDRISS